MNIAFDTGCISMAAGWRNKQPDQAAALEKIFRKKRSGKTKWKFYYLDAVRREIRGTDLDRAAFERGLDIALQCFDEVISSSRAPFILPVTFPSATDNQREEQIANLAKRGAVSKGDAKNLSDAIGAGCVYFVTADMRLVHNAYIKRICRESYGLTIQSAVEFEYSQDGAQL